MSTLEIILTAFVAISAIALVAQAVMVFGMFRAMKELKDQVATVIPKAEAFLSTSQKTMEENRTHIADVTRKASLIMDSAHKQMERVDHLVGEFSDRARTQVERVELILDDTVGRVHETVVLLNSGIMKPIREVNGLAAGLRAGVQYLLRGTRPSVAQATADEEMFI